jgi:uncharacterized protein
MTFSLKSIFGILLSVVAYSQAFSSEAVASSPSFNCEKAWRTDEQAICSSDLLSQMDNVLSFGFTELKRIRGKGIAKKLARNFLKERQFCGSENRCILRASIAAIIAYKAAGAPIDVPTVSFKAETNNDAVEPTSNGCKIEDWNYTEKARSVYLNGTTTCSSGKLIYALYDASSGAFIASDYTYIEGFAFQSYTDGFVPSTLRIKYSIEPK